MNEIETDNNDSLQELSKARKEEGDDLYSKMRDKLSFEEDMIADQTDCLLTYGHSKLPKEKKRAKKLENNSRRLLDLNSKNVSISNSFLNFASGETDFSEQTETRSYFTLDSDLNSSASGYKDHLHTLKKFGETFDSNWTNRDGNQRFQLAELRKVLEDKDL